MHTLHDPSAGRSALALTGFLGLSAAAGLLGARTNRSRSLWYRRLRKPLLQPPARVFGPVWTLLYGAMALAAWRLWRRPRSPERSRALALWGGQLALNAAWTPLFFGAHRPRAALVDLGLLWGAIAACTAESASVDRGAAALMLPYLGWTTFAGALNEEVVRLNP